MNTIKKYYLYTIFFLSFIIPNILLFINYAEGRFIKRIIYLSSFICFSFVFIYYLIDLLTLMYYKKLDNGIEVNLKISVYISMFFLSIIYLIIALVWSYNLKFKLNSFNMFLTSMFLVFSSLMSYSKSYYLIIGDNYLIYKNKIINLDNIIKYDKKNNNIIVLLLENKEEFFIPDSNKKVIKILKRKVYN
ncbi:hypothetical protein Halha_1939 [Halobacteroides halobius DSM 5150]|uniref:Uncharacterized protein n=1 Tax=Halobacteroides halobius (strain ATCC 35273 / DSM 5150 / MD-1) TaxID=748449 RepID=L0KCQ3_HALHC|nr:hypothetical protein [Halobacteroides halobius]AGB41848.1 hypothetical protein Halha_1939 [Halobacteroides halobius DSM 5150]